jgi:uncharacterized protein YjiS (DUF1127 family)
MSLTLRNNEMAVPALDERAFRSPELGAVVDRLLRTASHWRRLAAERRQLAKFSRRELADIGLNEADALAELNKPFWRD